MLGPAKCIKRILVNLTQVLKIIRSRIQNGDFLLRKSSTRHNKYAQLRDTKLFGKVRKCSFVFFFPQFVLKLIKCIDLRLPY